jgi:hypothetical protein
VDHEDEPMKDNLAESSDLTAGAHGPRSWGSTIVLALAVGSLAVYAIVSAPAALRTVERVKAEQIRLEDLEHCEKFRMPPGSEAFATCVADLTELRRRHRDRIVAEAAGVF